MFLFSQWFDIYVKICLNMWFAPYAAIGKMNKPTTVCKP